MMDTPFALRGYLSGAGSRYGSMDGMRRSPASLEQLMGHNRTVTTGFPYGSSRHHQQTTHPSRNRAVSGSSAGGSSAIRPLSPHLALKKPQLSATYSISHRISGAAVASLILASPMLMKFSAVFEV